MEEESSWKRDPATWAAIVISLLLWASAFAGIRAGLRSFGPGEVALLRFGTASIVLGVYAAATRMKMPRREDIGTLALAGFLGITTYHVALNYGEVTVTAGAASLLISAGPIFTAIMSTMWLGERLSRWGWAGVLISFAGVALISLGEGGHFEFEPATLLVLLAAVATAAYFIVAKRPLRRYRAIDFTTHAIWFGTAPMLVFAPGLIAQIPHAAPADIGAVLYLGVFPGALAYLLWNRALARMPASVLSAFLYLQPLNAIVIAWFWLREVPTALTLVGGTVALGGVVVLNTLGAAKRAS